MSIRTVATAVTGVVVITGVMIAAVHWIPLDPCTLGTPVERYKETVDFLSTTMELVLGLCTGLLGLSAAVLIGIQGNLKLSNWSMFFTLLSMIAIAASVLCAILWKFQISNLWFNGCYELVGTMRIQALYRMHFCFFLLGVLLLAIVVALVAFERLKETASGGTS
ncbi:hypothetical protein [Sinorhizobium medicae]|uniref:hypothetical protein n=1 Tax=Sinorhizobium medicae TaxID=110321 RepID=UPI00307D232E